MPTQPTQQRILADLDPANPSTIQALIDFHRSAFGGWKMMADDDGNGDDAGKADDGADDADKGDDGNDKPLGPNGEKALSREREARKQLEQKLKQIETDNRAQQARLAEAFDIKKDSKSDNADVVSELQKTMNELKHDNLVERVARTHSITDEEDLELLRDTAGEEQMRKLATRLGKTKADDDAGDGDDAGKKTRSPKSDASQGKGGGKGSASSTKATSVAQVMADRRAAREAKKQ